MGLLRALGAAARPGWSRLGAAAILGAGVAAGQAPFGFWWLSLLSLAVLIAEIAAEGRRARRLWLSWAAGGLFRAGTFSG
ncbi:MAG: hypothetical protein M9957_07595 [Rhodobacteraceae bacterium]|nr:hypothetical protein [Paracoccaceae bacterium]